MASERELIDIVTLMSNRIGNAILDALQLVDEPKEKVKIVQGAALAIVHLAAGVTIDCYEEDTGNKLPEQSALYSVLRHCAEGGPGLKEAAAKIRGRL